MASRQEEIFRNPFWRGSLPDPFVLKVRGRYYAYGTESGPCPVDGTSVFPVLTSDDFVYWRSVGKAMPVLGQPYFWYWAPEVTAHNGRFLMYYAVHTAEFVSAIRVAVADSPEGPFIDSGHDLTSHLVSWAIDPHVFRDRDGQWYLYMTVELVDNPSGLIGTGNVVDRLVDPFTLEGRITRVTPPTQAWQLFEAGRKEREGKDWYTVEGPAVMRYRRKYYEMFSGGCFYRDNYAVSYAISDTLMGQDGLRDTSWQDWEGRDGSSLLIRSDSEHIIGPGHNSLVPGPNNVDLYVAYHAWEPDMTERRPCLDRLFWHGDELWTPAPTYTPQPLPGQPRMRELFEQPALQPAWNPQAGRWNIAHGEVVQKDESCVQAALQHQDNLSTAWLLEVNLRHVAGDGLYGVLLQCGSGSNLQVTLSANKQLAIYADNLPTQPLAALSIPEDFVLTGWHQLIISFSGSLLRAQLDYLQPLEAIVEEAPANFALFTQRCSAAFSGISLTDHFLDEFLDEQQTPALLGWTDATGATDTASFHDWRVYDGALEQTSSEQGDHIVLKGICEQYYEFSAAMQLRQPAEGEQPAFGVVIAQNDGEGLLVMLSQTQSRWLLTLQSKICDIAPGSEQLELDAAFDPFTWHTLRLRYWDDLLTVHLDGPEVLHIRMSPRPVRTGLVTRAAAVAFTSVYQTGLPVS